MSGTVVDNNNASSVSNPTDIAGHMLDLDEDDDLEVFSKVIQKLRRSCGRLQTVQFTGSLKPSVPFFTNGHFVTL